MARQRTRRKIELGWFEAVVLLLGYVGSLAVVGAAGIYIGQRVVPERLLREERVLRLPVPADGAGSEQDFGKADPEMTFRRLLGQKEKPASEGRIIVRERAPEQAPVRTAAKTRTQATTEKAAHPTGETPARVSEKAEATQTGALPRPTAAPAAVPREDLRSLDVQAEPRPAAPRAKAPASGREAGRRVPPQGVTAEAAATARALQAGTLETATPPAEPRGQARDPGSTGATTGDRPQGVTPAAVATARAAATPGGVPVPAGTSEGTWSVQVNATMDEALARSLAQRLRERGYDAYVVGQLRDDVRWYRVRVGRLESIEKANELVSRLKEKEGMAQAFVASD